MDAQIMGIAPLTAAVIILTLRFVMHAFDKVGEVIVANGPQWYAKWPFWRSILKLGAVTLVPVWLAVKSGMNGVPEAGLLGSIGTGLSMSAIASELHLLTNSKKGTVAKLQARLDEAKEKIAELREKLQSA